MYSLSCSLTERAKGHCRFSWPWCRPSYQTYRRTPACNVVLSQNQHSRTNGLKIAKIVCTMPDRGQNQTDVCQEVLFGVVEPLITRDFVPNYSVVSVWLI